MAGVFVFVEYVYPKFLDTFHFKIVHIQKSLANCVIRTDVFVHYKHFDLVDVFIYLEFVLEWWVKLWCFARFVEHTRFDSLVIMYAFDVDVHLAPKLSVVRKLTLQHFQSKYSDTH